MHHYPEPYWAIAKTNWYLTTVLSLLSTLSIPVTANRRTLQINPFFEIGGGWNNRDSDPEPNLIAGVGLGVEWKATRGLDVRLDYGIPLVAVRNRGDLLQDNGFYFSLRYQPF